jgi:hypothetical protein
LSGGIIVNITLPWDQAGWRDTVDDWITAQLAQRQLTLTGPISLVQQRAWSAVLHVPTAEGSLYFKASAPVLGHEPGLLQALTQWYPEVLPEVLAVEPAQGWLLMRDSGVTLRSLVKSVADLDHWRAILPLYARLQQAMIPHTETLLKLGALDRRLCSLPEQVARLLEESAVLLIDQPDGLTSTEYGRLRTLLPEYAAMCRRLADYGIPETLHHEDFHDANIFVNHGRYTFADWGESAVAHPFFTLLVTLRSITYRFDLASDGPETLALRDVYLVSWTDYGSLAELRVVADLAARVAMPARALTWHRVLAAVPEAQRAADAGAVPGWLQEFLWYHRRIVE